MRISGIFILLAFAALFNGYNCDLLGIFGQDNSNFPLGLSLLKGKNSLFPSRRNPSQNDFDIFSLFGNNYDEEKNNILQRRAAALRKLRRQREKLLPNDLLSSKEKQTRSSIKEPKNDFLPSPVENINTSVDTLTGDIGPKSE